MRGTRRTRARTKIGIALWAMLSAAALAAGGGARGADPAPEPPGKRIAIAENEGAPVTLYYEEHGQGEPLLLLHGLGESTFTWHEIVPELAKRYRVITLDLKGFGRSGKPAGEAYGADDQAALVARFIATLDLKAVTLIGHSFGGTVALRTALDGDMRASSRIRRIAVISSPALPATTARYLDLVLTPLVPETVATVLPARNLARFLLKEAMGGREPSDEMVTGYAAPYDDKGAVEAFLATARTIVNERNAAELKKRYRTIKEPVLVVWCRKDPIVPLRSGRKLAAALPRARLAILEGCHHLPQHERPKELLTALKSFLGK